MKKLWLVLVLCGVGTASGQSKVTISKEQKEVNRVQGMKDDIAKQNRLAQEARQKRAEEAMKQPTRELQLKHGAFPKTPKETAQVQKWEKEKEIAATKKAKQDLIDAKKAEAEAKKESKKKN